MPQHVCFEPSLVAEPSVTVRVTLTESCPSFPQIELEARYIVEDGPEQKESTWFPLEASEPRKFQAILPPPPTGTERSVGEADCRDAGEKPLPA